jgi:glucose-6-phosphate isomerase
VLLLETKKNVGIEELFLLLLQQTPYCSQGGGMQPTYRFTKTKSYKRLSELALKPLLLNQPNLLDKQRFASFHAEACRWQFLYATERVTQEVMEALYALAEEADVFNKMEQMQKGAIVNKIETVESEKRKALHTACRFFACGQKPVSEEQKLALAEWEKLRAFIESKECQSYTDLIVVGIGGSDLGPFAVHYALQPLAKRARAVHFINNLDPDLLEKRLTHVPLQTSLVAIVSKSGTTLETKVNDERLRKKFKQAGLRPEEQFVSVTCPGSTIDDPNRYKRSFYLWEWVGGRFSCTSMVGCLPLAFSLGILPVKAFFQGAFEMDQTALTSSLKTNLPLLGALLSVWNHNFLHLPTQAIIPYSDGLKYFPAHFQQVEMESNGKSITKEARHVDFSTAMVVWGEPGTCSQHSFFQQLHQGERLTYVEFVGFARSQIGCDDKIDGTTSQQKLLANLFAQAYALAVGEQSNNPNKYFEGNRPSHILLSDILDPYSVGAYLAYLEHKATFEGFLWNINSFDQEGVQLGKRLADELIAGFSAIEKKEPVRKEGAFHFLEFLR